VESDSQPTVSLGFESETSLMMDVSLLSVTVKRTARRNARSAKNMPERNGPMSSAGIREKSPLMKRDGLLSAVLPRASRFGPRQMLGVERSSIRIRGVRGDRIYHRYRNNRAVDYTIYAC
jgi:hypothetical protein